MRSNIRFAIVVFLSLIGVAACGGGGGGGGETAVPTRFSISGTLSAPDSALADSDTNDPAAPNRVANDAFATAQLLPNPVTLGGYVNIAGAGNAGASAADPVDVYKVDLAAGQSINLVMANSAADIDLQIYNNATPPALLASSVGTGTTESLTVGAAGTYHIVVAMCGPAGSAYDCSPLPSGYVGASNYSLNVGIAPAMAASGELLNADNEFVPGEVVVRFKDNMLRADAGGTLQARAASVGLTVKAGGAGGAVRTALLGFDSRSQRAQAFSVLGISEHSLSLAGAVTSSALSQDHLDMLRIVKALRRRADIATADPNYIRHARLVPNDTHYGYQWHYPLIKLPQAWDITTGTPSAGNVIVAVVDTGVVLSHPDLSGKLIAGFDFIINATSARDGGGIDSNADDPGDGATPGQSSWHGTHVAGTVGARSNNSAGVAGVSWGAQIMPIRVLGQGGGTSYDIIQGIRFAARLSNDSGTLPPVKADIINLSLGGGGSSASEQAEYTAVRNAGVIIIAAAGNENTSTPSFPASYDGVVSVSAVDINKQRAPYSNFGTTVDVAAPGGDTSVDRNNDSYADGVLSTLIDDSTGTRVGTFTFYQGTSMAAPHMAGVVALMKAVKPTLTPAEVDNLLAQGSITEDIGTAGRDNLYGHGLIDAFKAVTAVSAAPSGPVLMVDQTSLNFGASGTTLQFIARNGGAAGTLTITSVTDNAGWLTVTPAVGGGINIGTAPATFTATIDRTAMTGTGVYAATITVTAGGSSVPVQVSAQKLSGATPIAGNAGYHYVLLLDPNTFTAVSQRAVSAVNGRYVFNFSDVAPGEYLIGAGTDFDNDGTICDDGEACGMYPQLNQTARIFVRDRDVANIDFITGFGFSLGAATADGGVAGRPGISRIIGKEFGR